MSTNRPVSDQLLQHSEALLDRALAQLPGLVGALLTLLVGWLLARLLRAASRRLLRWLDTALVQTLGPGRAARVRLGQSAPWLGALVFWAVLLLAAVVATQVLGLDAFTAWLLRALDQLPSLVAGLVILVVGYLLSRLVADLVQGSSRLPAVQRNGLARAAQVAIVTGAVLVGADQMGVKVTFLAIFAGAVGAAVAGGAIVAVSLGARQHVANLIGAQQLRQSLAVGQTIRVLGLRGAGGPAAGGAASADLQGRVLDIDQQHVLLESAEGRVLVPAHLFSQHPVVVLAVVDEDSSGG